jgi:hypothetical protein
MRDIAILTFPTSLVDRSLAVNVGGLGPTFGESGFTIENAKMLWDAGAQSTIIPEEILSDSFREFLKKSVPEHRPGLVRGHPFRTPLQPQHPFRIGGCSGSRRTTTRVSPVS